MSAEGNQHIAQVSGSTLVCVCGVHVFLGFSVKGNVKRSCLSLLTLYHGQQRPCKQQSQHAEMLRQD